MTSVRALARSPCPVCDRDTLHEGSRCIECNANACSDLARTSKVEACNDWRAWVPPDPAKKRKAGPGRRRKVLA